MMLFTSGWFGSPTTTTAYPFRLNVLACSWAFVTKGQVASTIVTPFASNAPRSERGPAPGSGPRPRSLPHAPRPSRRRWRWRVSRRSRSRRSWRSTLSSSPRDSRHAPQHLRHHFVHGQGRRVDVRRVVGYPQGGILPRAVLHVAPEDVPQDLLVRLGGGRGDFEVAATGAHGGHGVEEEFHLRVGEDDRAGVPPFEDDAPFPPHLPLLRHQRLAHGAVGGDRGCAHGPLRRPDAPGSTLPRTNDPP